MQWWPEGAITVGTLVLLLSLASKLLVQDILELPRRGILLGLAGFGLLFNHRTFFLSRHVYFAFPLPTNVSRHGGLNFSGAFSFFAGGFFVLGFPPFFSG